MIEIDPDRAPVTPRDAATVILVRDERQGFSVFMVRRHGKSGFMAGAHVFPGGVLDEADHESTLLSRVWGRTAEEAATQLGEEDPVRSLALHVAALRETFEEAGVLLADGVDRVDLASARARLNGGEAFPALVEELALTLRVDALTPWSRWVTPVVERRRYDARFFLARAPRTQRAEHDRVEVTEGDWLSPEAALTRFDAGEISLPPPTLRTLEQLRGYGSLDEAIEAARGRTPRPIEPFVAPVEGGIALTLPGDPEHPIDERRIEGPTRFVLVDGQFRSREP